MFTSATGIALIVLCAVLVVCGLMRWWRMLKDFKQRSK